MSSKGYAPTHILFPVGVKERLKRLAAQRGTTISELVREVVERYLEEAEKGAEQTEQREEEV